MLQNDPSDESIFALALEKPSPTERLAFVRGALAGDPALCARVEGLLRSHEEAGSFLQQPLAAPTVTVGHDRLTEGPGTRIGSYKLLQQIGEGGMGVVYMAEQEEPVRRKVALKIIKPGMDSDQVVARFEAERQALAMMDHTNIARVYDAGTTDSGRPYFVMELIHGVPITTYCDQNQLDPRERLELFIPVCQAVQHAHQKGVIHRDIKPSNVLVTMYDDKPVPKVIDFGVAKAVEQRLTERTLFTQYGALVGTFEYMSPEQAEMNAFGVDTRSDIYSLGVLLYELLTGTTPLEKLQLRQAALGELIRLIKEEEPPRPSVRLSGSGDLLKIAAARKTEPARLSRLVRGEVDWIVMKCLEKDRTRRYETANALARDVERHLKDEPVEACPPSAGYLVRKFTRKYRTPMAIASAFALLLLAGVVASTWQAARAKRAEREALTQRDVATRAEREALTARGESDVKRGEAERARQSLRSSLYASDLQLAQAAWESGNVVRMRELLDGQKQRTGEDDLRGFEWHYLQRLGSTVQMSKMALDAGWGGLSPDGTHYVYMRRVVKPEGPEVSWKTELRLIDVASGRQVRKIDYSPGETMGLFFNSYPFSPDSKRFAFAAAPIRDGSGREDWRIKVFEWETGRDLCTLADFGDVPEPLAFDPSGERLVVVTRQRGGTAASVLRIREVSGGKEVFAIPLPDQQILPMRGVAFSPDGTRLAVLTKPAGPDTPKLSRKDPKDAFMSAGEARVMDASSGKELLRFRTRPGSTNLAYSPDGQRLVDIGSLGTSHRLRDARSGKEVLELTTVPSAGLSKGMAFSPDGSHLAVSSEDGKVRIWDLTDDGKGGRRDPESILAGMTSISSRVAWSADGRRVSVNGAGGTVMTWQVATRAPHAVVRGSDQSTSVSATLAAAGPRFAAAFMEPGGKTLLKTWDEGGNVLFAATDARDGPKVIYQSRTVELNRDGSRLAYMARDSIQVDGKRLARKEVARLRVLEIASGRELFRRDEEGGYFYQTSFSPDGRRLATTWLHVSNGSSSERTPWVSSWDLETGRERLHLDVPNADSLAFSPDGRRLAIGVSAEAGRDGKGELRVFDAVTGQGVLTRKFAHSDVLSMAYNRAGTLLAVAVGESQEAGVIHLLDPDTGRERFLLAGHRDRIWKLAFSPDGRRLASLASFPIQGSEVKLWDLAEGREMLTLQTSWAEPMGCDLPGTSGFAFSPDGDRLTYMLGGARRDAHVQVWDATPLPDDRAPSVP